MRVDVRLNLADFQFALAQFLPVTIWLDAEKNRYVYLGEIRHVSIAKDVGVRVAVPIKVNWTLAGLDTAVDADLAQITVRPEFAPTSNGFELVFKLGLEGASLKGLPPLFDSTVVAAINAALERLHLAWGYTKTLNKTFPMGDVFDTVGGVTLEAGTGKHEIAGDTITLSLQLQVGFARREPASTLPPSPQEKSAPRNDGVPPAKTAPQVQASR